MTPMTLPVEVGSKIKMTGNTLQSTCGRAAKRPSLDDNASDTGQPRRLIRCVDVGGPKHSFLMQAWEGLDLISAWGLEGLDLPASRTLEDGHTLEYQAGAFERSLFD